MGRGYGCTCAKCGYHVEVNFGVGFLFPHVYEKTVEKVKNGELGSAYKKFFEENPDAAINCENVMLQCEDCGEYGMAADLTAYLKKEDYQNNNQSSWCVAFPFKGASYVTASDLEEGYTETMRYPHKCNKCHGKMRIIKESEFDVLMKQQKVICPKCKLPLELTEIMDWD